MSEPKYQFKSAGEYMIVVEYIRTTIDLLKTPEAVRAAANSVDGKANFTEDQKRYARDFFQAVGDLSQAELAALLADYQGEAQNEAS